MPNIMLYKHGLRTYHDDGHLENTFIESDAAMEQALAAFNRSEAERLRPLWRRIKWRLWIGSIALGTLALYIVAVWWETRP